MALSIIPSEYYFAVDNNDREFGSTIVITPKEYWDTVGAWFDDDMPIESVLEDANFYRLQESVFEADIGNTYESIEDAVARLIELGFEENNDLLRDIDE